MSDAVTVLFGADTSKLESQIGQAKSQITDFGAKASAALGSTTQGSKSSQSALDGLAKTFEKLTASVVVFGAAAASAMIATAAHAIAFGQAISEAAGKTDQTVETMSALKPVADRAGLSIGTLGDALYKIQTGAAAGTDKTIYALKAIGLTAEDVANLTQTQLAGKLADAFSKSADSANKAAAATALFGDSAEKLMPQINRGSQALAELEAGAQRAGVVIGPQFAQAIAGTNDIFSQIRDHGHELTEVFDGLALRTYSTLKPAIDGLLQSFADLVGNVVRAVEYLTGLDSASGKSAGAVGLIATAAQWFSREIVSATTWAEEFGVRAYAVAVQVGNAFKGLGAVVVAFANDMGTLPANAAKAFAAAFDAAIAGVSREFGDLAKAGRAALNFDVSGAEAALADIGNAQSEMLGKIGGAFKPLVSNTAAAFEQMKAGIGAEGVAIQGVIDKLEAQKAAQLALIDSGGAMKKSGTAAVGDPAVPAADKAAKGNHDAQDELRAALTTAETVYDGIKSKLASALAEHEITMAEWTAQTDKALNAEAAGVKAAYDKMLASATLTSAKKAEIMAEEAKKLQSIMDQEADANKKLVEEFQKQYEGVASTISGAFTSQFDKILQGTENWRTAMANIARDLSLKFINESITMTAKWIADQAARTMAGVAGASAVEGANVASSSASLAASAATMVRSILGSAAESFAGVFGFLSPVLGPAAAGPAAAAYGTVAGMAGAVASADIGMWQVPQDQLALVHHNELIMPAAQAGAFRNMLSGDSQGGAGARSVNVSPSFHVHSMDSATVASTLQGNRGEIMKAISKAVRDGAHHGLKF